MKYLRLLILLFCAPAFAQGRFYYEGDGNISLYNIHNKKTFQGAYRDANGNYDPVAIQKINGVFNVPADFGEDFSLRTLSFIDFLEDQYAKNKRLELNSSYRSPAYNATLPNSAQTSYHTDAMAADVVFPGKDLAGLKDMWDYAVSLHYGGVGFYERDGFLHIDSGRPRSWTQDTSGTEDKTPQRNKNIYLSVDRDIYQPGEKVRMFFSGVSQYPFHVSAKMVVHDNEEESTSIVGVWPNGSSDECVEILAPKPVTSPKSLNRSMTRQITWQIPDDFSYLNKKLSVRVSFCNTIEEKAEYPNMPVELDSRIFEVHATR